MSLHFSPVCQILSKAFARRGILCLLYVFVLSVWKLSRRALVMQSESLSNVFPEAVLSVVL